MHRLGTPLSERRRYAGVACRRVSMTSDHDRYGDRCAGQGQQGRGGHGSCQSHVGRAGSPRSNGPLPAALRPTVASGGDRRYARQASALYLRLLPQAGRCGQRHDPQRSAHLRAALDPTRVDPASGSHWIASPLYAACSGGVIICCLLRPTSRKERHRIRPLRESLTRCCRPPCSTSWVSSTPSSRPGWAHSGAARRWRPRCRMQERSGPSVRPSAHPRTSRAS